MRGPRHCSAPHRQPCGGTAPRGAGTLTATAAPHTVAPTTTHTPTG